MDQHCKGNWKNGEERPVDGTPAYPVGNLACFGLETPVLVVKDSFGSSSEVVAVLLSFDIRSEQTAGDDNNWRSMGGGGVRQKVEGCKDANVGPGLIGLDQAAVANAVCVAVLDQVGEDMLVKAGEMVKKLEMEYKSLYGNLVAGRAAHAHALMDQTRLQQGKMRVVERKEEAVRLWAVEKIKRKNSAMIEQVKKGASAVTLKAAEKFEALAKLLEQPAKKARMLLKVTEGVIWEPGKFCKCMDRVEYKWDGL